MPNPIIALGPKIHLIAGVGTWKDTGGTTPAVADGDAIARWDDQSGNGYHLTQATAGNRPTLVTNRFKTFPAVNFNDAASQWLTNASFPWTQSKTTGVWIVAVQLDSGLTSSGIVTTTQDQLGILCTAGGVIAYLNGAAVEYGTAAMPSQQGVVLSLVYNGAGSTNSDKLKLFRNFAQLPLSFSSAISPTTYPGGTTLYLGRQSAGGYMKGRIVELAFFATLSDADRATVVGYLGETYFSRTTKDLLVQGDSRAAGYPSSTNNTPPLTGGDSYPLHARVLLGTSEWTLRNAGSSGLQWASLVAGADASIDPYQDDWSSGQVLVAFAGTNDFVAGRTVSQCQTSISTWVAARHAAGFNHVYVGTQPQDTQPTSATNCNALNTWIRANAFGADRIVDFGADPHFDTVADCSDLTIYESDGVHMTDAGNVVLASVLVSAVHLDYPSVGGGPNVIYIYDTFDGVLDTDLTAHVGQAGAVWTRPTGVNVDYNGSGFNSYYHLGGNGRVYGAVNGYRHILYVASGDPGSGEYDIRATLTSLSDPGGDNFTGIAFLANPATLQFWAVGYEGFGKKWGLCPITGTSRGSYEATYADVQSTFPTTRELVIKVRNTAPYITVSIDGVDRLSTNSSSKPGTRIGLYQTNGNPPDATSGMQYGELSAGTIGYTLPLYNASGPADGPPGFDSDPFTVSLVAGANPGTITITPQANISGVFNPTSVTLTDAGRSGTFTFKPSVAGVATITFTNNGGSLDLASLSYNSAFLPPTRLSAWHAGWARFHTTGDKPYLAGATNPNGTGGYYLDAYDHYDPIWCFQQIQEYSVRNGLAITDWSDQINAGLTRFRDRAVRAETGRDAGGDSETPGVIGYHRYATGIMMDYFATGDPKDVEAVGYLQDIGFINVSNFIVAEEHDDKYRETAFWGLTAIDYEVMGVGGTHPLTDVACTTTLNYHDHFLLPETQRYGATYKPFMIGIGVMFLIRYWERYRDSSIPAKVANIARIPNSIRNMCQHLWDHDWYPAGIPAPGEGWMYGSISYKSHALTDPNNQKIEGLAVTSVVNPRSIFRGPASLSAVDGFYNNCRLNVFLPGGSQIADTWMIHGYTGATREIVVNPTYILTSDISTSHTFSIWPASWAPLDSDGDRGPSPDMNPMVLIGFAWSYWYTKHIAGDEPASQHWRKKFISIFDGAQQMRGPVNDVKQNNQSVIYTFKALEYFNRADTEWPVASNLTLQGPPSGNTVANRGKAGPYRVSIPYGKRIAAPEGITPSSSTGAGAFSTPAPIVTSDMRVGMFTYTAGAGDDNNTVTVSIAGETLTPNTSQSLVVGSGVVVTPVTTYTLTGPASGAVGQLSSDFTITLGAGDVAAPIRFTPNASAGGGIFIPSAVDLTNTTRSGKFNYMPLDTGARDIIAPDNAGLTDPGTISFNATPAVPGGPAAQTGKGRTFIEVVEVPGRANAIVVPYED